MAHANPVYLLDANILMEANNRYYGLDLCPGFWDFLIHQFHSTGRILSIDRVEREILHPPELVVWAGKAPAGFFASTASAAVAEEYAAIMQWVNANGQFTLEARAEFAGEPDGWLIAYAKANDCVVVTHETFEATIKKRVKIPNVCRQFGVPYIDPFTMLKQLGANFEWTP